MLKPILITCLINLLISSASQSQSELLSQFTAVQAGNSVHLTFTVSAGITCLGIEIERSPDTTDFNTIGEIPGICGSGSQEVTYTFVDLSPLTNKENYYRLLLGQVGYSETIKIQFIDYNNGAVIIPNPIIDQSSIYFQNSTGETFQFRLYDSSGRIIRTMSTQNSSLQLQRGAIPAGIYFLMLDGKSTHFEGKIVVQ